MYLIMAIGTDTCHINLHVESESGSGSGNCPWNYYTRGIKNVHVQPLTIISPFALFS